jgi:hypothetical protein
VPQPTTLPREIINAFQKMAYLQTLVTRLLLLEPQKNYDNKSTPPEMIFFW